jgi:hypothetical protein
MLWISSLKGKISHHFLQGIGLVFIGALPLLKMFYVASDLQGSRFLYFSVFGWSVMLASIFQGLIRTRMAYIILAAFLLLGFGITLSGNLVVWEKAEGIIQGLPENVTQENAPDNFHGAYILRNGLTEFKMLRSEINELKNE